jgi:GDP-4-dehydro-6-deoxy-D-mannose reductase
VAASRPTVLVTGGAGFAAGHLFDRLLAPSAAVVPRPRVLAWHRPAGHPPPSDTAWSGAVSWRGVDLMDLAGVERAIADDPPDHVYHLAGATHQGKSFAQPTDVLRVNTMGTDHLLRGLARQAPRARVLVTSTGFVYRPSDAALAEDAPLQPASPYALSKLAQELVARHAGATTPVEVIVCRPFNHLGPRQSADYFAPNFARQIAAIGRGAAPPVLKVGNLTARRDLTDVRDVVRAYVGLMAAGSPGAIYNVCSGVAYAVRDVLDGLIALSGVTVDVQVAPELLRPVDQPLLLGTRDRVGEAIGWAPEIPLEETLRDLLAEWSARA